MKMNLYLLLYNRVGDSQPGGCKRYQGKGLFMEFVLVCFEGGGRGAGGVTQLMLGVTEKLKDWEPPAAG